MLKKKMIRDIKNNISQYITIFLMIVFGLMAYTGIEGYMLGMSKSATDYYTKNNLQDLDAFGNFDDNDIEELKKLDNVNDINGKLTFNSLAKLKGTKHDIKLIFIKENTISKFYVLSGINFEVNKKGCWIDSYYAKENDIKIGDMLTFIYDKYELQEEVLGIIYVPDRVYDVKDESEVFPDHKTYGFAYMSINDIPEKLIKNQVITAMNIDEEAFDKDNKNFNYKNYIKYNSIMIDVNKEENKKALKEELEKSDKVAAVIDIKDELSYQGYQSEIDEGKSYIGIFSGLFLFIALLSVITTMMRLIKKERTIIGTLKALGISNVMLS